ncbi:hypothetical protein ACPV4X_26470 [Vibrio owensii]|uniref:hypothetical protein n=1 Tax=Vibrio owensii TaxID=696485 RepID=UPI0040691B5B
MRISYEYLAGILSEFLESPEPHLSWKNFDGKIKENQKLFFFHIFILRDKGLIVGASNPSDIGVEYNGNANMYERYNTPIRLTATGHDFADALSKPSIREVIIDKFKDEGISAVLGITKSLAEKHAEKLLSEVAL